jgi:hypothetical protein
MVEVNQKTEDHCEESNKTQMDLQVVKESLDARTDGLIETRSDTKEHLEIELISFKDRARNIINTNQGNMEEKIVATRLEFQSHLAEVVASAERRRGTGA